MSQTKYKLSDDLKTTCLSLVKGYDRRVKLYRERREAVLSGNAPAAVKISGNNSIADSTADKAEKLVKIEELFDTRAMRAVEQAINVAGKELHSDKERQKMIDCIMESCTNGRGFCFAHFDLHMHKDTFYERRREFLWNIADYLNLL